MPEYCPLSKHPPFAPLDLMTFAFALEAVAKRKIDVVVVLPGSRQWWDDARVQAAVEQVKSTRKLLIILENGPLGHCHFNAGPVVIRSDSSRVASTLAKYAMTLLPSGTGNALLVFPGFSENAVVRRKVFEEVFRESDLSVETVDADTWYAKDTELIVRHRWRARKRYDLIVCGNDQMALGAVTALSNFNAKKTKVIGYDGILRAIASVAEIFNPFAATMRIPPSIYGREVAQYVRDVMKGLREPNTPT